MFIISQIVLRKSKLCKDSSVSSYSIALGLVIYVGLYLYLLFRHNQYLPIFNKFVVYVVGLDLLLSAFLYYQSQNKSGQHSNGVNGQQNNNGHCEFQNEVNLDDSEVADTESDISEDTDTSFENDSLDEPQLPLVQSQETERFEQDTTTDSNVAHVQQQLDELIDSVHQGLQNDSEAIVQDEISPVPRKRGRPPKAVVQTVVN